MPDSSQVFIYTFTGERFILQPVAEKFILKQQKGTGLDQEFVHAF